MPLKDIKKFLEWILSFDWTFFEAPRSVRCLLEEDLFIVLVLKEFKFID